MDALGEEEKMKREGRKEMKNKERDERETNHLGA